MATPAILSKRRDAEKPAKTLAPDRYWLHLLLLAVTFLSTTTLGMRYMTNFQAGRSPLASEQDIFPYEWALRNASQLKLGLSFSTTLLGILLTHEFGHYFACRWFGVRASLPFMLPAPTLSGTAGAVIQLRSRVKSRAALLSIGALGPISGFVLAIFTSAWGLILSPPVAHPLPQLVYLHEPLLLRLLVFLLQHIAHIDRSGPLLWHPVLLASWIGLLITSLNLVPAGQLDGGHILYSYSPKTHGWLTYVVLAILVYMGVTCWFGWLLWMGLLLLPGMRHPWVQDPTPPKPSLMMLGPVCLLLSILTTTPQPFTGNSLIDIVHRAHRVSPTPATLQRAPSHQVQSVDIDHDVAPRNAVTLRKGQQRP